MFWSAALDLKTQQRPPPRPSYGSFSRSTCNSNFHIPQSIPEHQPVSQFTSPVPTDLRRVEEYYEQPDTASARTRASLQLSEHTQTALKLLLQGERDLKLKPSKTLTTLSSKFSGFGARLVPMKELPERTPLMKPLARAHGQEPNPQENDNEYNYWMQELERRRAGMKRSRRRTCISMSERATTSPLKVGVVMCSVPLMLVLGFALFVMLFGDGTDLSSNVMKAMNNLLGPAARHDVAEGDRDRIRRAFTLPPEENQPKIESPVLTLNVSTRLRGTEEEGGRTKDVK